MFAFTPEYFNGNINLTIFINFLLYSLFLILLPIIMIFVVSKFKPNIKKSSNVYLYAFSSAILILIATFGFFSESHLGISDALVAGGKLSNTALGKWIAEDSGFRQQLLTSIIITSGAALGIILSLLSRIYFSKFFGSETHQDHSHHEHQDHIISFNDVDNPKAAWLAILLLLSHRIVDGIILGTTITKVSLGQPINVGLIVTFNIHIFIEVLIIYYRQIQYGQKIKKAVIYNLISTIIFLPVMLISAFLGAFFEKVWWLTPFITAAAGAIITFVTIIELVPEFIHLKDADKKKWYNTLIFFCLGILVALVVLSFHSHSHNLITNI